MSDYAIELYDTWGRRIATWDESPLMRAQHTGPDNPDTIRGILPGRVEDLGHAYRLRVLVDGEPFLDARVVRVRPTWSDTRRRILDRVVNFHEIVEVEAVRPALEGNAPVQQAFVNRTVDSIVRDAIDHARGPAHYLIDHTAYPDGALREFGKFAWRQTPANELEVGGIAQGDWVGSPRLNVANAVAVSGDTIGGLEVDGAPWPDLRLMMTASEQPVRDTDAIALHPEVAAWSDAFYAASAYKRSADRAQAFLQELIDTKGIDFVELNPHRGVTGAFDNRIDAQGRHIGFVYGGGQCFNAATIENGHARVAVEADGAFLEPGLRLKEYYSYDRVARDSIAATPVALARYDVNNGLYEILTALAYAAGGFVWTVDNDGAVFFRAASEIDRVVFFDRRDHALTLGSDSDSVVNMIVLFGNPIGAPLEQSYARPGSVEELGERRERLELFSIAQPDDADALAAALLDDLAYPAPDGEIVFHQGQSGIGVGDLLEFRDAEIRRLDRRVDGEWGDRFFGRHVARVKSVTHEFRGRIVTTTLAFTSPLRSVDDPLRFIVRGQPPADVLFQFRLDDEAVGLDLGYHLD